MVIERRGNSDDMNAASDTDDDAFECNSITSDGFVIKEDKSTTVTIR